jgi:hypothetical protein
LTSESHPGIKNKMTKIPIALRFTALCTRTPPS